MPSQDPVRSPSRRPQLTERQSSTNSVSKGSPKGGPLLNTHKGSSTRLHKTHAVGHGRLGHARVNSHGKGLNKLSKLAQENFTEDDDEVHQHRRSVSHTPSTSPHSLSGKRNSSAVSLHRPATKGFGKRNVSHPNLGRNGNTVRLGNQQKSEKSQLKKNLLRHGDNDEPVRGTVQFEIGDDTYEDEWTDSGSQSPVTTRTHSRPKTPVTPTPKELPTPDEPPERLNPQLPHSPPESPKPNGFIHYAKSRAPQENGHHRSGLSHPPDAYAVTNRLLSGSTAHATPQTSNVSANVTPHHVGSPKFGQSQASTLEASLPADGISRFLSGSNTPGSVSHLTQNLSDLTTTDQQPQPSKLSPDKSDARRVKSAINLTHPKLSSEELPSSAAFASNENNPPQKPTQSRKPFKPSPFESARGANPSAGKSYTQLKMNLDREAVSRDPPLSNHPLLTSQGSMLNLSGAISTNPADLEQRLKRQYLQAQKDVQSCRKYYPDVVTGKIPEAAVKRHQLNKKGRGREKKNATVSAAGSAENKTPGVLSSSGGGSSSEGKRGRVRFQAPVPDPVHQQWDVENAIPDGGGVDALLRRIWMAPELTDVSEGE